MKKLLFLLALLGLAYSLTAQVYSIHQEKICWTTPAQVDSSLNRYIMISNLDNRPTLILSYSNASGADVDVSAGGTFNAGYCGTIVASMLVDDIQVVEDSIIVLLADGIEIDRDTVGPFGGGGSTFSVLASNGLNDQDGSSDVDVELGGILERNTTVTGDDFTYTMRWDSLNLYSILAGNANGEVTLDMGSPLFPYYRLYRSNDSTIQLVQLEKSAGSERIIIQNRNPNTSETSSFILDNPGEASIVANSSDVANSIGLKFHTRIGDTSYVLFNTPQRVSGNTTNGQALTLISDQTGKVEFGWISSLGDTSAMGVLIDEQNSRIIVGQSGATYDLPYRDPDAAALPPGEYLATFTELGARGGTEGWVNVDSIMGESSVFRKVSADSSVELSSNEVVTVNYSLTFAENLENPARGAYSVRRIYLSYTGPAFTVENNAGDTLQVNFLPGLGSVYDTTAVLAFDDTVYVKRWYDQSGFGNHLEVTALSGSGKGPYMVRNGALVKDNEGQLAVRFINTELSCLSTLTDPWGEHTAYSFGARFQDTGTNLGPFASARGSTNDGFSMYYTGGDLRITGNGYQIASGGPYAVGTIANVAPANTPNNIFAVLSADTVNVWNDGTPVTLSAAVTGSVAPTTLNDTLFVMGRNTNGATSFWYYDGYVSEVLIWGQDASLDEEAVSQGIVDYYDNALPLDASSSSIVITLPVPSASNLNKSVDITHNGQQGENTIVKTESGIGYFLYRESVLDSIEISSTGNASVTLRVTQDFDDNYYYQLIATTEIDSRLLDSIDVRLDPQFVYASQYNTIDLAVEAAKAESKTLVVDVLKSKTGTLDLDSLTVMVAQGGFLSVDTLTANGAILISPGPRNFLNNDTRVEGQWNTVGNTYIEWTSNVPSDSISTWNALRNAVVMGEVELMNKTYRVNKQGNNDIQDSPIIINGQGEGESVLVLTNPGQHFTGTTKGSALSISNCTIVTSDFEQGNYNNNTAYVFAQSLRSNTNEDLVTDIPFFRLNNVALKGEVKFTYGMSGTETTKPDSVTFANSGVKSLEIKNSYFEGVRDVVSLNNTFARKAVVEHNEVYNLFGAFYSQLSTLADSLDSPYRISDIDFEHNIFLNDSTITYSGGAYLSPLVVKARNVNFNDNDITGIRKINTGADVHVCYPSVTGSYWATNNRIRNVWEAGEGSAFKFKGAVEAHVNNNKFTIDREELFDAGLIDASGFLIDSASYAFALVDKEDQNSYTKVLEMRDNDIQVPIWNKSTTVRDVSSFKLVDNNFYFGQIEAEPPAGWAGNTLSNTIFYSSQTSTLVDTLSSFISKGNVWTVESVENDYVSFLEYTTVTNSDNRLTPIAYFDDIWNVDNVSVHYMPPYANKYVNKSKIAGSGQFKIMQGGGLTGAKGYSFEQGEIDLTILESDYINAYPSDALLPLSTNLNANIEIKKVNADTLLLLSGRQNDWSSGWIGSSEPIFVQVEAIYTDTTGRDRKQVWKLNYTTGGFAINHYHNGELISYNPQTVSDSLIQSSSVGIDLYSIGPGASRFQLKMVNLLYAEHIRIDVRINSNDFSSINPPSSSFLFDKITPARYNGIDTIQVDTLLAEAVFVGSDQNALSVTEAQYTTNANTTADLGVRLLYYDVSANTYTPFASATITSGTNTTTVTGLSQAVATGDWIYVEVTSPGGSNANGLGVAVKME